MPKQIHLDGTTLEGGGQLLRLSIALSSLTHQPLKITDIRGNRHGGGGLKLQHLTGVQWLSRACGASTRGAEKKSRVLEFWSKDDDVNSLKLKRVGWCRMAKVIDIGSPGAIGLVLQAILPYVLFAGTGEEVVRLEIRGGTNVSNSCSVDYMIHVLSPMLEKIGIHVQVKVGSRGWSTGRTETGSVSFEIKPFSIGESLPSFQLTERGELEKITAVVLGSRGSEKLYHKELTEKLEQAFPDIPLEVKFELSGHEKRLYALLVAHTTTGIRLGRDQLFQERISSLDNAIPKLASRVVEDLRLELKHGGCVDEFLRDQLVVFQTLANGKSKVHGGRDEEGKLIEASLHAQTAQWVASEMVGVEFDEDGGCGGLGWVVGESWDERIKKGRREEEERELVEGIRDFGLGAGEE